MNLNLMKRRFYLLISFLLGGTMLISAQSPVDKALRSLSERTPEERASGSSSRLYCQTKKGSSPKAFHEECIRNDSRQKY